MQYAEVVPNRKLSFETSSLTYKIPPEILAKIRVGSLVLIPIGNSKTEGLVIKIKRAKAGLKEEKLKSILKLLEEEPLLDEIQLKLAKWLSEYYLAPISLCLFEMLPIPPKRIIKSAPAPEAQTHHLSKTPNYKTIKKLCERVIKKQKRVLVISPSIAQAEYIYSCLFKDFKKVGLYHGGLKKTERFKRFLEIKNGCFDIVVGSRTSIFAPLSPLGAVIINDEESDAYKNERSPKYNTTTVAEKLSKLTGSKLILISQTPSSSSYFKAKRNEFYLIRPPLSPHQSPRTKIIDLKQEAKKGNYSPLSEYLTDVIKDAYKKEKRVLLFVARRGAASYVFCRECGFVFKCKNCEVPLVYHLHSNQLFCHHCNLKQNVPSICKNCKGTKLRFSGTGTEKIENEIKKLLPAPKILRIDQEYSPASNPPASGQPLNYDTIIGTQKIFSYINEKIDIVGIVSIDALLNLPDFNISEKIFAQLFRLKSLASSLFIAQTYHPENFIIKTAIKGDYRAFYQKELLERKKFNFPPFCELIRIIYQHKDEKKTQKEIELLAEKLRFQISDFRYADYSGFRISLLGPSPCFYPKLRGKYRWQIILKIKDKKTKSKNLFNLLKTLPSNFTIDVEPATLL